MFVQILRGEHAACVSHAIGTLSHAIGDLRLSILSEGGLGRPQLPVAFSSLSAEPGHVVVQICGDSEMMGERAETQPSMSPQARQRDHVHCGQAAILQQPPPARAFLPTQEEFVTSTAHEVFAFHRSDDVESLGSEPGTTTRRSLRDMRETDDTAEPHNSGDFENASNSREPMPHTLPTGQRRLVVAGASVGPPVQSHQQEKACVPAPVAMIGPEASPLDHMGSQLRERAISAAKAARECAELARLAASALPSRPSSLAPRAGLDAGGGMRSGSGRQLERDDGDWEECTADIPMMDDDECGAEPAMSM